MKGGTPESPSPASQLKYDLDATYARVDQIWGLSAPRDPHGVAARELRVRR